MNEIEKQSVEMVRLEEALTLMVKTSVYHSQGCIDAERQSIDKYEDHELNTEQ